MIHAFGYQGRRLEEVLAFLDEARTVLVDVRISPRSRNPVWNRGRLEAVLGERYVHVPELGNTAYRTGGIAIADLAAGLAKVEALARDHDLALMCVCAKPDPCHRSLVTDALQERGYEVKEWD